MQGSGGAWRDGRPDLGVALSKRSQPGNPCLRLAPYIPSPAAQAPRGAGQAAPAGAGRRLGGQAVGAGLHERRAGGHVRALHAGARAAVTVAGAGAGRHGQGACKRMPQCLCSTAGFTAGNRAAGARGSVVQLGPWQPPPHAPLPAPTPKQVVLTSVEPRGRSDLLFDAYEYTVQSHTYTSGGIIFWMAVQRMAGARHEPLPVGRAQRPFGSLFPAPKPGLSLH